MQRAGSRGFRFERTPGASVVSAVTAYLQGAFAPPLSDRLGKLLYVVYNI